MVGHENARRLGWLGTGRMGVEMARRLLAAGCDLAVYNRSAAKADPLVRLGAKPAGSAAELAAREIVFVTVGTSDDLTAAVLGPHGLMSGGNGAAPAVLIDCSTVSAQASAARAGGDRRARDRVSRRTRHGQPQGGAGREDDGRRLRTPGGVRHRRALPEYARPRRYLCRRGRGGQDGEALPQPVPGRGRAVPRRDNGARGKKRHQQAGVPGLPQQERDGFAIHRLQVTRLCEPGLRGHVHGYACCGRISTSAWPQRGSTRCLCRWPRLSISSSRAW